MITHRAWRKVAVFALALLGLGAALLVRAEPAFAALPCPRCLGFEHLDGAVYVDPAMSAGGRARFVRTLAEGEARAAAYLGGLMRPAPVILACASDACVERMGGGRALGYNYGLLGMRLSPFGLTPTIIAHERAHWEVGGRVGLFRTLFGALPTWFDEGFAVLVSEDTRYLRPRGADDRCVAEPGDDLPDGTREWARRASADHALYARAACRVVRWGERHGGRDGLLALIAEVGDGASFKTVWDRPSTEASSIP